MPSSSTSHNTHAIDPERKLNVSSVQENSIFPRQMHPQKKIPENLGRFAPTFPVPPPNATVTTTCVYVQHLCPHPVHFTSSPPVLRSNSIMGKKMSFSRNSYVLPRKPHQLSSLVRSILSHSTHILRWQLFGSIVYKQLPDVSFRWQSSQRDCRQVVNNK